MVYTDQTQDFKSILGEAKSQSSSSTLPSSKARTKSTSRARPQGASDEFLKEAYRIHNHLSSLTRLLKSIRKPYLSTDEPPPLSRRSRIVATVPNGGADGDELARWEGQKYLSERERDEIDVRTKMILRRCRERVSVLEDAEKARHAKVAPPPSAIYTFLPSLAPIAVDNNEPLIAAHRASIIWTLTNLLAHLSATQTDLQEERAKRRAERSRTLGGGAAREAAAMQIIAESSASVSSRGQIMPLPAAALTIVPADEPPIESQLSAEQLQQFESENSTLLEHMESQLGSVLAAEKSLLEISAMQTELVRHLVQQTEVIDRLYDEAVGSVAEMGKANQQLKQAKERGGEARFFLLMFLVGASLALLFLNWYA